ncbi:MAG: site-2 protease family protein [Patescibacteria group bacterium]
MTAILFILIIAVLVFVHELGHFLAAKFFGVRVDEFGLGFPPRAIAWKKGETTYSLNFVPFGGFVKIFGETPNEETEQGPDRPHSLTFKPKWQQALILFGGVFFNWLFAWLLISIGFMSGLPMSTESAKGGGFNLENTQTAIIQIMPGSPAEKAGLTAGDKIIYIATAKTKVDKPNVAQFQQAIKTAPNLVTVGYERRGSLKQTSLTPINGLTAGGLAIGVALDEIGSLKLPVHLAVWHGFDYTFKMTGSLLSGLKEVVTGLLAGNSVKEAVVGPIGIAGLVGDARALGFIYVLTFAAFISLDLAIINLIPFPALDGGRLFFLLIEAIKGSPIKPKIANIFNLVGFLLLICLMVFITIIDIIRSFN